MEFQGRYGAHSLASEIQFLKSKAQTELDEANGKLLALQMQLEEEATVHKMLDDLPEKIKHPVMVPFGGAAFFPGHLVHSNEVMVNLGASHIVECSAKHAEGMLGRRMTKLGGEIKSMEERIQSLRSDIRDLECQEAEGMVDIVEEYDEAQHGVVVATESEVHRSRAERKGAPGLATVPETSTEKQESTGNLKSKNDDDDDDELFAMMDRMAKLEKEAEAQEAETTTTSTSTRRLKEGNVDITSSSEKGASKDQAKSAKKPSGLRKGFLAGPRKTRTTTRKDDAKGVEGGGGAESGFLLERKEYQDGKVAVEENVEHPVAVRGVGEGQVVERGILSTSDRPASESAAPEVDQVQSKKPMSRFKQQMMKKRAATD
ncbi:hypothetical protein BSKO_03462 [Bryopsis sp. KO-2023]|nr:hypothetical protein BSKO_03462 [Bryopsis sp. KO-2023]